MASVEPHGEGDRLVAALLGPVEGRSASERRPLRVTYAEGLQDGRTLSISPEIEALLGYTQIEWMAEPYGPNAAWPR